MTPRPTITTAVIAQNEAAHIASLLQASAWCDETLVVDGGSRDETVSLARQSGARVVERRFDNFATQRNAALAAARTDWVLFVDADERPTPALIAEVRRRTQHERCAGYRIPIRSRILGRPFRFSGTQNDLPLRLVRREAARWSGEVHEICEVRGAVGRLDAFLEHETHADVATVLAKIERYTALAAAARTAGGEAPRRLDAWVRPPRELFRRLIWKQGWLDGPEGWLFAALSGYSEWVLARRHRRLWQQARRRPATDRLCVQKMTYGTAA
jgi:(heptosyl)LPS beta-1,4-glucosyltransferase